MVCCGENIISTLEQVDVVSGCLGFGIFVGPAPHSSCIYTHCSLIGIVALRVVRKCTAAK